MTSQHAAVLWKKVPMGWLLATTLILLGLLIYHPVGGFDFVVLDDDVNVLGNPFFAHAPLSQIDHFWGNAYQQLYIPVTYTFWAVVAELSLAMRGRLEPALFHYGNLFFHILNSLLVAMVIRLWRPQMPPVALFLGACLFLLHPMQVEAVAWVTGFKDVFSATIALCCLGAYLKAQGLGKGSRSVRWVILSWFLFLAAVLAKPSQVFLFGVLALVELGRIRPGSWKTSYRMCLARLAAFIVPAVAVVIVTSSIQVVKQGSLTVPLWLRPVVALDALGFYFVKTIVPYPICLDYGRMPEVALKSSFALGFFLAGAVGAVWLWRKSSLQGLLLPGLLFWLAALSPTLGLIPFAFQRISTVADRYQYLALAGMALVVAEMVGRFRSRWVVWGVALAWAVLAVLNATSLRHWSDSFALFHQTLRTHPGSFMAYDGLGIAFYESGKFEESIAACERALEIKADFTSARTHLADSLMAVGRMEEAIMHYRRALRSKPSDGDSLNNLGAALIKIGSPDEAVVLLEKVLSQNSQNPEALNNLGLALFQTGRDNEAEARFRSALRINPKEADFHGNLANVLARRGRKEEAARSYREAIGINPKGVEFHHNLGNLLVQMGQDGEGLRQMEKALVIEPENTGVKMGLAWVLATAPQDSIRSGPRAVQLALEASRTSGDADPQVLRVLAAARAQNGEFPEAVRVARRALDLLADDHGNSLAGSLRRDIQLYQGRKPHPARD